jgi:hypothetical protein
MASEHENLHEFYAATKAQQPAEACRIAYTIELTADEYRSAEYMSARGYLGCVTEHATETEDRDDGSVVLKFTESDAWNVQQVCEDDEHAVWSLTTPSTSLGQKFQAFLDQIV